MMFTVLTRAQTIDADIFWAALEKTVAKRKTADPITEDGITIERVVANEVTSGLWSRYQKKFSYAADITWETSIDPLRSLNNRL